MTYGVRSSIAAIAAAVFIAGGANAAMAQKFSVSLDAPTSFKFVDNSPGGSSISADSVSGFGIALMTPLHIGIGMTQADAVVNKGALDGSNLTFQFKFTDLLVGFHISRLAVTLGYGNGKLTLDPKESAIAALNSSLAYGEANATQTIVGLGWMLTDSWDLHVAYHSLLAKDLVIKMTLLGTPYPDVKGDVGAVMYTAGLGYYF